MPISKYHLPEPASPFLPFTMNNPVIASRISEPAKKSATGLQCFTLL